MPDITFFEFAQLMLEKYKNKEKVKMISGTNYLFNKIKSKESYYFSKYYSIWGWATWKRAWNNFDFDIKSWLANKKTNLFNNVFKEKRLYKYWTNSFDNVYNKKIDTWDYQWAYACLVCDGLTVTPTNNLVSNIGNFGTHGNGDSPFINMPIKPFNIKDIVHPKCIEVNNKLDKIVYKNIGITRLNLLKKVRRLKFAIFKMLKKMLFIKK